MMRAGYLLFAVLIFSASNLFFAAPLQAQNSNNNGLQGIPGLVLGNEYSEHARVMGKRPAYESDNAARTAILYLPNRLLDLLDIFRVDVGVGPGFGAVGRVTRYGQFGYRTFSPASVRVGLRGRKLPVFLERSSEFGAGPAFVQSKDRETTPLEIGGSADLLIAGVSAGVSVDEFLDFAAGIFCVDLKKDDIQ